MKRKRLFRIPSTVLFVLSLGAALCVQSQQISASRHERESIFIMLHCMIAAAVGDGDAPKDFDSFLRPFGGRQSGLMKSFPDGLVYMTDGSSFTLEEPRPRMISLFKKDRLIASERKWPRWESSGEYARKFAGQEVPASGYE